MNNYKYILERNNLKANKITIIGKITIIDTTLGKFVLKKRINKNIYDYLLSRGFNNIPRIIDFDDNYILEEYIDSIDYNNNEKAQDFIKLLSNLHIKTCYFENISNNDYKKIYEELSFKINNLYEYYNNLINNIESKVYFSPSEYLLSRNISVIFSAINYSLGKLEEYKDLVKNINKKRIVTLYNNCSLDNFVRNTNGNYFLSFDKSYNDSPIYDLVNFYNKYELDFDFINLLKIYETKFPLLKEESTLFLLLISIPEKIIIDDSVEGIKIIKKQIDKIYNKIDLLNFKEEEGRSTKEDKDNKE